MSDILTAIRAALAEFRRVYRRRQWMRERRNTINTPF